VKASTKPKNVAACLYSMMNENFSSLYNSTVTVPAQQNYNHILCGFKKWLWSMDLWVQNFFLMHGYVNN